MSAFTAANGGSATLAYGASKTFTVNYTAPVANAGPDQTVPDGTLATIDGRASRDLDSHAIGYEWRDEAGAVVGTSSELSVRRQPGRYTYLLTVFDQFGFSSSDSMVLTVTTNAAAPEIVLYAADSVVMSGWQVVAAARSISQT